MPELYRKVTRILRANHFVLVPGGKGSHEKWRNNVMGRVLIVPRNLKSRHTANAILKDAGVSDRL